MDKTLTLRDPFFDTMKAIAIFMVTMQHCYMYLGNGNYEANAINQAISLISVPAFMMICGYFMYPAEWPVSKLLIREKNLISPFLFWSFAYFILFHSSFYNDISISEFSYGLLANPYFCSPLWFFRTLGLVTLITFICKNLFSDNELVILIAIFIFINFFSITITNKFAIQSIAANMGYFIIGYTLHKYTIFEKRYFHFAGSICCLIFTIAIYLKISNIHIGGGFYSFQNL